jgi:aconitate hydratase
MQYKKDGVPLVVFAGKEYGTGSSRDWAAKGTILLGIKAVVVESFERIHRSNLVGMGVLPLQFRDGETRKSLGLTGEETVDVDGIAAGLKPGQPIQLTIKRPNGETKKITVTCRIDTADEIEYYRHGGILHYVLRGMMKAA